MNTNRSRESINPPPTRTQTRERIESAQARFGPCDRARTQTLLALLAYFGNPCHEATYCAIYEPADDTGEQEEGSGTVPTLSLRPSLATLLKAGRHRKPLPSTVTRGEPTPDGTAGVHSEVEDWRRPTP